MNQSNAIKCFSAIAHDGRLSLIKRLIKAGPSGMASGDLAKAEGVNTTTASAQLLVLANSGLVSSTRQGKQIIYAAQYDRFQHLANFLMTECCAGDPHDC
jgi:predicted transcriptional regulator